MKISSLSAPFRTRTLCARVLVFVLLVGIVHAVTFGSAHSHANVSSSPNRIGRVAERASVSSNIPLYGRSGGSECLVCLLHRQLSNSIVHSPVFVVLPSTEAVSAPALKVLYSPSFVTSSLIARPAGRAPPRH